ncbi:MAG TPA: hypothetical protein VEI94_11745 [Candidatus Bathyarchaeia archaeon]|nr:hypothetical protein [Candidatus Bathyarchaeia archaeon]
MRSASRATKRAAVLLLCAGTVALAALSPRAIPFSMDEFVHDHALGCALYPLSGEYQIYREGCTQYALRLPFGTQFHRLRSFDYIGSAPGLPFFLLRAIVPRPVVARIQGALYFLLALWLSSLDLGVSFSSGFLAALVFPLYPLAFVVDTGPTGPTIVLLAAAMLALRRGLASDVVGRQLVLGGLAGLAVFLGFLTKPTFAWLLPPLVLIVLGRDGATRPASAHRSRILPALAAFATASAVPALILVLSTDVQGRRYLELLLAKGAPGGAGAFHGALQRLVPYFVDGAAVMPRMIRLTPSPLDVLPALVSACLIGGALLVLRGERRTIALLLGSGAIAFAAMTLNPASWAPHHAVLALVFVVWAMAIAIDRLPRRALACLVAAIACFWLSLGVRLASARTSGDTNASKDRLVEHIWQSGLDARTVQVHVSWGTYYISHLFGDRSQIVLYIDEFDRAPAIVAHVRELAARYGRTILVIAEDDAARGRRERALHALLGEPRREYRFGNWSAVEYSP